MRNISLPFDDDLDVGPRIVQVPEKKKSTRFGRMNLILKSDLPGRPPWEDEGDDLNEALMFAG